MTDKGVTSNGIFVFFFFVKTVKSIQTTFFSEELSHLYLSSPEPYCFLLVLKSVAARSGLAELQSGGWDIASVT